MPQMVPLATIQEAVTAEGFSALVDAMAAAFTAYSVGKAVVCPVQHLGPFRDGASGWVRPRRPAGSAALECCGGVALEYAVVLGSSGCPHWQRRGLSSRPYGGRQAVR